MCVKKEYCVGRDFIGNVNMPVMTQEMLREPLLTKITKSELLLPIFVNMMQMLVAILNGKYFEFCDAIYVC